VTFVLGAARYEGAPTFSAYLDSVAKLKEVNVPMLAVYSIVVGFVETVVQHSPEPYAVGAGCPQPG